MIKIIKQTPFFTLTLSAFFMLIGCESASSILTTPVSVHASLVGTYDVEYSENSVGGIYNDGDTATLTLAADGTFTLDTGARLVLTNPTQIDGVPEEILWTDGSTIYAVSNNSTGNFNKINVTESSIFKGEFTEVR